MDIKLFLVTNFFVIILPSVTAIPSLGDLVPGRPIAPGTICNETLYPSWCNSVLPNHTANNVYDHGRYLVRQSLRQSTSFLNTINGYLIRRFTLPKATIAALEDCQLLTGLNIDFLGSSLDTMSRSNGTLSTLKADDTQTLLSATLTNQQTCWDGLQAATPGGSSVRKDLSAPLLNDTKLYSVSLALFTKGWVPVEQQEARDSPWKPAGRKLLQTGDDGNRVLVRNTVVVNQDGSGNFTTINEAIAAAPNNTAASKGYFLIYVKSGFYEEYVSIPKKKKYLMMVGDGINQTIITGNRSVEDGWSTFNSATFGKSKSCTIFTSI